ncbi:MAG: hypothetical protein KAS64_09540 [Spirochaetes bacterium]|nr:hypothetical protein [Spirochaetota bacterium]
MKRIGLIIAGLFIFIYPLVSNDLKKVKKHERIRSFHIEFDKLVFTVFNSGYTDKSSFTLNITKKNYFHEIELIRIKDDFGKMMPKPIKIVFTQDELKDRINIKNPIKILNLFCFNKL